MNFLKKIFKKRERLYTCRACYKKYKTEQVTKRGGGDVNIWYMCYACLEKERLRLDSIAKAWLNADKMSQLLSRGVVVEDLTKINLSKLSYHEAGKLRDKFNVEVATKWRGDIIRAELMGWKVPKKTERHELLEDVFEKLNKIRMEFIENRHRHCMEKQEEERKRWEKEAQKHAENSPVLGPKFLLKGKTISDNGNVWKIINYDPEGDLIILVLKSTSYFSTYLDEGRQYTLFEHKCNRRPETSTTELMEIWEIPAEQMKRSSSQLLLYLWEEGPSIDLDF